MGGERWTRVGGVQERVQGRWWGVEAARLEKTVAEAGFHDVRQQPLPSEPVKPGAVEAPELFTLTARRPDMKNTSDEQSAKCAKSR